MKKFLIKYFAVFIAIIIVLVLINIIEETDFFTSGSVISAKIIFQN